MRFRVTLDEGFLVYQGFTPAGKPETMPVKRLMFVADDFGLDNDVNEAIIHAHQHGVLNGASLMMGQPATSAAVVLARENPDLQIGCHLHLNDSRPCTRTRWPWGRSPALAGMGLGLSPRWRQLARREMRCQWTAFLDTGLPCRFVNVHHHLHLHPYVRRTLLAMLPPDFAGWLRWGEPRFFQEGLHAFSYQGLARLLLQRHRGRVPFPLSTTLWGIDRTFAMDPFEVATAIDALGEGLHEFLFHPRHKYHDRDAHCLIALKAYLDTNSRSSSYA